MVIMFLFKIWEKFMESEYPLLGESVFFAPYSFVVVFLVNISIVFFFVFFKQNTLFMGLFSKTRYFCSYLFLEFQKYFFMGLKIK